MMYNDDSHPEDDHDAKRDNQENQEETHENTETGAMLEADEADAVPVARTIKSLRQLGINSTTQKYFNIQEYPGFALVFSAFPGTKERLQCLWFKANLQPRSEWKGDMGEGEPWIYNDAVLEDSQRREAGLFIVGTEPEVWVMHQNGLAAISLFRHDDPDNAQLNPDMLQHLAEVLQDKGVNEVELLLPADELGCRHMPQLWEALFEVGVACRARILAGTPGDDLGDLFAQVQYNRARFCEAVSLLAYWPPKQVEQWSKQSQVGVPEIPAAEAQGDLLPCYDEAALEALPMPECLISGVLLAHRTTLFTGKHNTGKSAVALDMAASISLGRPWQGRPTLSGPVFYLAAEGANGLKKRLKAWKQVHNVEDVPHLRVIPIAVGLHDAASRSQLLRTMHHYSPQAALLVVDTLATCAKGLDENSVMDMTAFLDGAQELSREMGVAVLIVHHNNRNNEFRGSSALPANCDGHLLLSGESGSPRVQLHVAKIKDFGDNTSIALRRQVVAIEGLPGLATGPESQEEPQTSVVFLRDEVEPIQPELSEKEALVLRVLEEQVASGGQGRATEDTQVTGAAEMGQEMVVSRKPDAARKPGVTSAQWKKAAQSTGVASATFSRAKAKLLDCGAVECDHPGQIGALYRPHETSDIPKGEEPEEKLNAES